MTVVKSSWYLSYMKESISDFFIQLDRSENVLSDKIRTERNQNMHNVLILPKTDMSVFYENIPLLKVWAKFNQHFKR